MAASVGRLRPDTLFGETADLEERRGWKFVTLSHNTVRGAAGGSVLNAELWLATAR
jgi:aspartate-semialdehyde dehydrogenase